MVSVHRNQLRYSISLYIYIYQFINLFVYIYIEGLKQGLRAWRRWRMLRYCVYMWTDSSSG